MKREPFVFNYRKPKTCKVCGKTVMMLRGQKTCDECRKKSDLDHGVRNMEEQYGRRAR